MDPKKKYVVNCIFSYVGTAAEKEKIMSDLASNQSIDRFLTDPDVRMIQAYRLVGHEVCFLFLVHFYRLLL